jgi:hypothetical protein
MGGVDGVGRAADPGGVAEPSGGTNAGRVVTANLRASALCSQTPTNSIALLRAFRSCSAELLTGLWPLETLSAQ